MFCFWGPTNVKKCTILMHNMKEINSKFPYIDAHKNDCFHIPLPESSPSLSNRQEIGHVIIVTVLPGSIPLIIFSQWRPLFRWHLNSWRQNIISYWCVHVHTSSFVVKGSIVTKHDSFILARWCPFKLYTDIVLFGGAIALELLSLPHKFMKYSRTYFTVNWK